MALIEEGRRKKAWKCSACRSCFYGPYFPAEQHDRWAANSRSARPDGETVRTDAGTCAKETGLVMVVFDLRRRDDRGVLQHRGRAGLGRLVPWQVPQDSYSSPGGPGSGRSFYFRPGNLGYPVFRGRRGERLACTSAMTATFRRGARGAGDWPERRLCSILRLPSRGLSEHLWGAGAAGSRRGQRLTSSAR